MKSQFPRPRMTEIGSHDRPYDQERNYERDARITAAKNVALTILGALVLVAWFFLAPRYLTR
jgi:hypothetical protein